MRHAMRDHPAHVTARDPGNTAPARVLWGLVWLVVVELVGSTYGAPLVVSLLYFAAVALIVYFGHRDEATTASQPSQRGPGRRIAGGLLIVLGLALSAGIFKALCVPGPVDLVSTRPDVGLPVGLLGCWCMSVGAAWTLGRDTGWADLERFGLLLGLAFLALLASGHRVQGLLVYPVEPWARRLAAGLALVVAILAATAGRWLAGRFIIVLLVGVAVRVVGLDVWQPDPATRDMLPLAQSAGDALMQGEHPYRDAYQMQHGSVVPLTYLPGLWGLHNLPRLLGLPLRLSSLLSDLGILASFWWVVSTRRDAARPGWRSVVVGLGAVWMLSPSVQWNYIYAEPHPWWGVMAVTLASALRGRWMLSAVALGVAVATRQFAWFIAPFWGLWLWRSHDPEPALRRLVLAGAVALGLVLPFAATAPDSFWFGTLRWFSDYGPVHRAWFLERLGFAGSFYARGLEGWLMPLQAAVAVVAFGVAWHAGTERHLLRVLGVSYPLFVMLGLVIWDSFYLGIFVLVSLVCLGLPTRAKGTSPAEAEGQVRAVARLPRWLVAAITLETVALVWLGYGYWATGSELGLRKASAALTHRLKPRDAALDVSRRRLAFVQPPLALDVPGGALGITGEFDPRLGEWGWFDAPRLALLYRAERDQGRSQRLARLGVPVESGGEGFYSWLIVERGIPLGRLSAGLTAVRLLSADGSAAALVVRDGAYRIPQKPWPSVEQRVCFVGSRERSMLFAHPSDGGNLELTFARPRAATRLVLVAGLDDRVVRWGRADVWIEASEDGRPLGALDVPNAPGPVWNVLALPLADGATQVTLALRTPDDRQRWLCVEGLWL